MQQLKVVVSEQAKEAQVSNISLFVLLTALVLSPLVNSAPTHLVNEEPVSIVQVEPGVFLIDFGRVAFGNLELTAPDNTQSRVTVHFGEALSQGRIDRNPPGTVRYKDTRATLDGGHTKVIAPRRNKRNTSGGNSDTPPAILTPEEWDVLIPYRWIELYDWPGALDAGSVKRRAAYLSAWDDNAAAFQSSDELLNRIWAMSRDSIKATTFAGVYVDGDRERIPYEGDAYLNQLSHYYTDYDLQMARDTFDYLMEYPTWPTEWASHMIFMAHADWMQTGDLQWLQHRYESLKAKLLLARTRKDGLVTSNEAQIKKGDLVDWPPGERDNFVFTSVNTVINAFHLRAIDMMHQMALALDKQSDAQQFSDIYQRTYTSFQDELFSKQSSLYRDGVGTEHSSLHANLFPLAFELVPEEHVAPVVQWLANRGMRCSVYAAQYLLEGLFENGAADQALALITAPGDRSWKHMLDSDATITWEAWDVKYKPNLDWNHAWGAAPANLLPRFVLGVEAVEPGWSTVRIRPNPGDLTFANGKVPTPRGPITMGWMLSDTFELSVELPSGVQAKLDLPAMPGSRGVLVNELPVKAQLVGGRWLVDELIAGEQKISVNQIL